ALRQGANAAGPVQAGATGNKQGVCGAGLQGNNESARQAPSEAAGAPVKIGAAESMNISLPKPHSNAPAIKPWSTYPDKPHPVLRNPPVWRDKEALRRSSVVTRAILAVLRERANT